MFSVFFEFSPTGYPDAESSSAPAQLFSAYDNLPGLARHKLYRSLRRPGIILSYSQWESDLALGRWRTQQYHSEVKQARAKGVLTGYHIQIGQVTVTPSALEPYRSPTAVLKGGSVTLIEARNDPLWIDVVSAGEVAEWLGFDGSAEKGCHGWDVFEDIEGKGDLLMLASWASNRDADAFSAIGLRPEGAIFRRLRIIWDYGMTEKSRMPRRFAGRALDGPQNSGAKELPREPLRRDGPRRRRESVE